MRIVFSFLLSAFLLLLISSSNAQKVAKVKRKGVYPVNVTKPPAKSSYSLKQFAGKWQETSRKERENNNNVDFTDTLFFSFTGDNNVYTRDGVSLSINGTAELLPENILTVAGDEYVITSLDKTKALLDDGEKYIHTITKKKSFWYEKLPTDSIIPEKLDSPISVSLSTLLGKWMVYRRDAKPGAVSNNEVLIKIVDIKEETDNTGDGEITFYRTEISKTIPCTIEIANKKLHITTADHSWEFDIYKANDKELIFGSSLIKYYCRKI